MTTRPKCGAKNRAGEPCQLPEGWGTPYDVGRCRKHGGNTPNGVKHAQTLTAAQEVRRFALPVKVDPSDALLQQIHATAGWVAYLEACIDRDGESSLFVPTINGEAPSAVLSLLTEQRKQLVAYCTAAIRAGVEERRVRLAERQGDLIVTLVRGILDDLQLTPEQQALVPDVVPRHLRSIAS